MESVLIADIGGTHVRFALIDPSAGVPERTATLPSARFSTAMAAIESFLGPSPGPLSAIALAVAGPVVDGRWLATNLPWSLDQAELSHRYGCPARLLNDFEAVALGMSRVQDDELVSLVPGVRVANEIMAVLGAGTGLGEALVVPVGDAVRVVPSEGGHADFAPWDARSDRVLARLRDKYGGHVSAERVASGMGLVDLFDVVRAEGWADALPETLAALGDDPGRAIGEATGDPAARLAVEMFARALGAEAGNLALKCLPRGGVRIAGGIVPKLLALSPEPVRAQLVAGYLDKGRMRRVLESIPVDVVLAGDVGLRGARVAAEAVLRTSR